MPCRRRHRSSVARRVVGVIAVAVLLSGLSACGSTVGSSGTPMTKDGYIQAADAVCLADNTTIASAAIKLGDQPTDQQKTAWVTDTVVPLYTHTLSALRALTPPKELASMVDAWLTAFNKALTAGKSNPASMLDGSSGLPSVLATAGIIGMQQCNQEPHK